MNKTEDTKGVYQCGGFLVIADSPTEAKKRLGIDAHAFKTTLKIMADTDGWEYIEGYFEEEE